MLRAISEAELSAEIGETPVGAVVVNSDGVIIGRGHNMREHSKDVTSHAEINAIRDASAHIGDWRLTGCTLYVTLEPCPMCAGAIISSRLSAVYYGAKETAGGSCSGGFNMFVEISSNNTAITGGILENECGKLLTGFFERIR